MTKEVRTMRPTGRRFAAVLLVLALVVAACGDEGPRETAAVTPQPIDRPLVFTLPSVPTPEPATAEDESRAEPEPALRFPKPREDAALIRLLIPKAKVDAPLQTKGVNDRREMEAPDGKDNVAWYDFSERPGFGGNAVFSGHVDWYTGERGVFWYLKDLKPDDEILLRLSDGTELRYRVTRTDRYQADTAPIAEIVGPTVADALTLITCEGVFDQGSRNYSDRRVVRAERAG